MELRLLGNRRKYVCVWAWRARLCEWVLRRDEEETHRLLDGGEGRGDQHNGVSARGIGDGIVDAALSTDTRPVAEIRLARLRARLTLCKDAQSHKVHINCTRQIPMSTSALPTSCFASNIVSHKTIAQSPRRPAEATQCAMEAS